jgi:hypothetical protein
VAPRIQRALKNSSANPAIVAGSLTIRYTSSGEASIVTSPVASGSV